MTRSRLEATLTVRVAVTEFLIAREADGLAASTLSWYRSGLGHLVTRHGDDDLGALTTQDVRIHIIALRNRYSEATAGDYVRQLHTFFSWCVREYGVVSPMRNISYQQPRKSTVPKATETADVRQLLALDGTDYQSIRNRAIVWFLVETGCRNAGLRGIMMDDLFVQDGYAIVTEKGNKTRRVYFTQPTKIALDAWLAVRGNCSVWVFYNIRTCEQLTSDGLRQVMKRMARAAGVEGRVNPHAFRHAFAKQFIESGGDIARLQYLMGHSDNDSTLRYLIFAEDEHQQAHKKHTPGNLY